MEAALWVFLGTLVGAASSILTSWIATRNESARQAQADSLERAERGRAFQRGTLLELQEQLQVSMRNLGSMFASDLQLSRERGEWCREPYTEDLNLRAQNTTARINVLTERVADDQIREAVHAFRTAVKPYVLTPSEAEAHACMRDGMVHFNLLMEEIGRVLRTLY